MDHEALVCFQPEALYPKHVRASLSRNHIAPGFLLCPTPATTILDTGSDAGNFLGVGIYVQGLEVVVVSEMEAGWYRYISEWRFPC